MLAYIYNTSISSAYVYTITSGQVRIVVDYVGARNRLRGAIDRTGARPRTVGESLTRYREAEGPEFSSAKLLIIGFGKFPLG